MAAQVQVSGLINIPVERQERIVHIKSKAIQILANNVPRVYSVHALPKFHFIKILKHKGRPLLLKIEGILVHRTIFKLFTHHRTLMSALEDETI